MTDIDQSKTGLNTVITEAMASDISPPNSMDGEQLALLPLAHPHELASEKGRVSPLKRGAGRPKGSKNKNTKEWSDYILGRYSSPLEVMASTMARPILDLAEELGFIMIDEHGELLRGASPDDLAQCLKIQLSCAKELAPYLHQKQPQAIDLGDSGLMTLNIISHPPEEYEKAEGLSIDIIDHESLINQQVTECENEKVNVSEVNVSEETAQNRALQQDKPTDQISEGRKENRI